MYYYDFTMFYANGKVSTISVEKQEFYDQLDYCRKGISGGWLKSFDYQTIKEEW